MLVDYGKRTLANRQSAVDCARAVVEDIRKTSDRSVVLNLGDNLATASWLDGFLGHLVGSKLKPRIVIVSTFEDTCDHIRLCLKSRQYAVLCARDLAALTAGELTITGYVTNATAEVFDVVKSQGESLVEEIAEALGISIPATQLRLNELIKLNVIERIRQGKAFVYQIPRVEARALSVV